MPDLGAWPVPDSALCRAAGDLLRATSAPVLIGHCERTFAFGAALLGSQWASCDQEIVYVASALHDLGLTVGEPFDAAVGGFQDVGALRCAKLVMDETGDSVRAQRARAAVALHLELTSANDTRPEVAAVHLGAAVDVLGARLDELPPGLLESVLEQWPRLGFAEWMVSVMRQEADRRPESTAALYVRHFGLLDLIAAARLPV